MVRLIIFVVLVTTGVAGLGYWFGLNNKEIPTSITNQQTEVLSDQKASDPLVGWQLCQNDSLRFSIKFPSAWFTTSTTDVSQKCLNFNPLEFGENEKNTLVKIIAPASQKDFNDLRANSEKSDETQLLLNRRQVDVNGLLSDRVEVEATGIGNTKGEKTIYYFFPRGTEPFVGIYTAGENTDSQHETIFDTMMSSISFL